MTPSATVTDYEWLVSPAASEWLAVVAESPLKVPTSLVTKLRRELSAARTSLVLQQTDYRRRGGARFELADRMFFTDKGLQQATDFKIAGYKANQIANAFPDRSLGADLCCGIGGDLMQFAKQATVVGFDLDPVVACLAGANLTLTSAQDAGSSVECRDVLNSVDLKAFDWWHCDPDRRADGKRSTQVALSSPSEAELSRLLQQNRTGSLKLAPAAQVADDWSARAELEWIGHDRQCQQLWVRFDQLARFPGKATATMLNQSGSVAHTLTGLANDMPNVAESIGAFLYEPAPAVIAARLTGHLANQAQLQLVHPGIAYLTGDQQVENFGLTRFTVEATLPFDLKRLKAALRERLMGDLEVKKRGVKLDPAELQRKLRDCGERPATLLIFPFGKQTMVAIATRDSQRETKQ